MAYPLTEERRYDFQAVLKKLDLNLAPISIQTLWVNITRLCNQACTHCHVGASPERTEQMSKSTIDYCLKILKQYDQCRTLDITGGAPELNPNFDYFVVESRKLNKHIVVRHNLTVTFDGNPQTGEEKNYLPEFFAGNQVEILASLPHYTQDITDTVRGSGVFNKSIEGIRLLNAVGYGQEKTGLILNLVYNAGGPILTGERVELEGRFRNELLKFGLVFNKLYAVTNMPINRFYSKLKRSGTYDDYMTTLSAAFNPEAARKVVCRSLISVDYDGRIYDCDFNQMLGLQITEREPQTIYNIDLESLIARRILFGSHCFGCTAGGGSS
jgi:radical SAM/Cys-rich protein